MTATSQRKLHSTLFIGLLFLVLNLITKGLYLSGSPISMDEPFSIFNAQKPLGEMLAYLKNFNNPPLHEIILHFWIKIGGIGPEWVRTPALIFASITSIFVFLIGKRRDTQSGIVAALLYSISTIHIAFSHDARAYPLFVLLSTVSTYLFLKLLEKDTSRKWIFLGLVNITLIYNHYFGFFVLLPQLLWAVSKIKSQPYLFKKYAITGAVIAVCYLPMFSVVYHQFINSASSGTWVQIPGIEALYDNIRKFANAPVTAVIFLVLLVTALIASYLRKDKPSNLVQFLIMCFLLPYLLMYLVSYSVPMFLPRYLMFTSIPMYILVAISISYLTVLKKYKIAMASVLVFGYGATTNLNPQHGRRPDLVAQKILEFKKPNTAVIFAPDWINLNIIYHLNNEWFSDPTTYKNVLRDNRYFATHSPREIAVIASDSIYNRLIYVKLGNYIDRDGEHKKIISGYYPNSNIYDEFGGATLTVFDR